MTYKKSDITSWKFRKTLSFKVLGMAFIISVALAIIFIYTENAHSQTTLYQCNTNNGINSSATNCLTNSPAYKYNLSSAPFANQTSK
ncbi:MAG: hypothetical protein ACTHJ2_02770 [Candidatus Nitrosocosmicus sp.]